MSFMRPRHLILVAAAVSGLSVAVVAQRTDVFVENRDHPAIAYTKGPVRDTVSDLNARMTAGTLRLATQPAGGYLRPVLDALKIPLQSQLLVFSQTSQQAEQISFLNPRALYYNDRVAVGWVRGADELEVAALDPTQGVIFYTLNQQAPGARFVRQEGCLLCHLTWDNLGVPGMMTVSSYPLPDDKNAYAVGFTVDHRLPLAQRWGGWFVTGRPGLPHLGNVPVMPADKGKSKVANPRLPLESVKGLFDLTGYLTPYSDVVSLLVFNHQTYMTNLLIRVGWEARIAAAQQKDPVRVREAARDVVDYMLFIDEAPLPGKVDGAAGFAEAFAAGVPRDSKGRSLKDLDLGRRLFRYPCSYLIYGEVFDALPARAKGAIYARLWEVLSGKEQGAPYKKLFAADKQAVLEILRETKKDLPAYLK